MKSFGPFVYRMEDTAFSRRGGGFDSLTGYWRTIPTGEEY